MSRPLLTALIPAFNEQEVLADCLASVSFADEVYVVDSFSTDRTLEIARAAGARIEQHEYVNSATQKNWAIPRASHPWVLLVDADERVSPELAEEILRVLKEGPSADGYWVGRDNYFLGKRMKHGGWDRDSVIRLFRRDVARYQPREVHAEVDLPGPLPWLRGRLKHDTFRSFEQYLPKLQRYAAWGASQAWSEGKRAGLASVLAHAMGRFLRKTVFERGVLDGSRGVMMALLSSYATYLKYALLWERTLRERDAGRK